MSRSGVFVGVDQTGGLQKLRDAASGATRMHAWALEQGMLDGSNARLITDAGGARVTPDLIFDAIASAVRGAGADQLILYFAGHGVNINRSEFWLLTDAPENPNAAVNVSGSVELARYCGIGHVVIISDACRVAAEGIQAQNVRGSDVFPNIGAGGQSKPVDQFFACGLGSTAAEIRDPALAANNYKALYTGVLLQALEGRIPEVLEAAKTPEDASHYVSPLALEIYLERAVPELVRSLHLEQVVNQNPDAVLNARSTWIAKLDQLPRPVLFRSTGAAKPGPMAEVRIVADQLTSGALTDASAPTVQTLRESLNPASRAYALTTAIDELAQSFGPAHFDTGCGIKVRGAAIERCLLAEGTADILPPDLVRIDVGHKPRSAVVRFVGGFGAVIPVLPGFIASMTLKDRELVDVSYEPSENSDRWTEYHWDAKRIRALRATAAAATQYGRFRLNGPDALDLAEKMRVAKGIDPTLSVYAAYAFHDLQELDRIQLMGRLQKQDLTVTFFDVALLGRELFASAVNRQSQVVPFVPLLSQGWSLLSANRVRLPESLHGLQDSLCQSLWTLFKEPGLGMLERSMLSGEVL